MRWLSPSAARAYAQLQGAFGPRPFSNGDAREVLRSSETWTNLLLSRLAARGWAFSLGRGVHVLHDPLAALSRMERDWGERLVGHRSLPPLQVAVGWLLRTYGARLRGLALFGSVARGEEGAQSDVDLLGVVEGLQGPPSERPDELRSLHADLGPLLARQWSALRECHPPSVILLSPSEVDAPRYLWLDLAEDAIVILDRDRQLSRRFEQVRHRLRDLHARRLRDATGARYWEVPRGSVFAEVLAS